MRHRLFFILIALLLITPAALWAQPIVDVLFYEHTTKEGARKLWMIASHPDGRIASVNYSPDPTAKKMGTLAADQELFLAILGIKDLKKGQFDSDRLDYFEKRLGKRIRRQWGPEENWHFYQFVRDYHRQVIDLSMVRLRVSLLNRLSTEDLNEYADLFSHIETYKGSELANIPAPHADVVVHFLIGEYGYEAVEFDRKAWQQGRIDTVYVAKDQALGGLGFGSTEKVVLYVFLALSVLILALLAWLITRFMQFQKEVKRSLTYHNRQLKSLDEMNIHRDDNDNLLRMVQLMIKYRQADMSLTEDDVVERLMRKRD